MTKQAMRVRTIFTRKSRKIHNSGVKYELFGFLSYEYPDGVALCEGVAFLWEEELLLGLVDRGRPG